MWNSSPKAGRQYSAEMIGGGVIFFFSSRRRHTRLQGDWFRRVLFRSIEPTKNIVQGFQAYEYLLERHPELYEKVTFLAFLVPSRQTLSIYRKYREEILKLIEDINQ